MKTKKLTPATVAPVKRENTATGSRDGNAIVAPSLTAENAGWGLPFAGDDAE